MAGYRLLIAALVLGFAGSALAQAGPDAAARKVLARFAAEPTVNEVQAAALRYSALHPELHASMRSRSRWANALPELTLKVVKDLDDESKGLTRFDEDDIGEEISATETKANDLQLSAQARFRLNETVFSPREPQISKENRLVAKERNKMLQTLTRVYFQRRRAQVELVLTPPGEATSRTLAELKIAELTAELDALTGGAFSRMVGQRAGQ